jgi:hypothetical protein
MLTPIAHVLEGSSPEKNSSTETPPAQTADAMLVEYSL